MPLPVTLLILGLLAGTTAGVAHSVADIADAAQEFEDTEGEM